ncbi:MAG: tetratricopeptide repeat protein, partial [Maribacter sp.]|nr:tetratricopeptide repeat protein [Maribacter sp.]
MMVFACNKQDSIAYTNSVTTTNDSIFKWIDQGKDSDFSEEVRSLLLEKAYVAASKSINDTLKPKYYLQLSNAYLKLKDSALFLRTNKESIVLAKIVNDSKTHAGAHWDLATYYGNIKLPDSAYANYKEAHILYDAVGDDPNSARLLYNMARSQVDVKDYTGAEINAINAIKIFKPLEDNKRLYRCYNLLGTISTELKEYRRALEYFDDAENHLDQISGDENVNRYSGSLQNNIGNVFKEQGDFANATKYYTNALNSDDSLQFKRPIVYAQYLINLSTSRLYSGDTLGLKNDLKVAKHIFQDESDNEGLSFAHFTFAEYFLSQKDTVQA